MTDLIALHLWVAERSSRAVADGYLDRIETRLQKLAIFPSQGAARPDLGPDVRTLSFERRLIVAYQVDGRVVTILRVVSGARDLTQTFEP